MLESAALRLEPGGLLRSDGKLEGVPPLRLCAPSSNSHAYSNSMWWRKELKPGSNTACCARRVANSAKASCLPSRYPPKMSALFSVYLEGCCPIPSC
jgi:hypothetical protein